MGYIPENVLDDILNRIDIVEVISNYLPLKRAGRNFKALCPFHQEKSPSFIVSPDRQIFHCFGCNCGGNAFNFLMRYERIEFPEAVEILAKKSGVQLPRIKSPQDSSLSIQLYKINEIACNFYHQSLLNSTPPAGACRDYLSLRGINLSSIKLFKLGYAPNTKSALINYLKERSINLSLAEKAGLITRGSGEYRDKFIQRIIFPIFNVRMKVVGFGARVMPSRRGEEAHPKYINSPETPIYIKGRHLYGLSFSRESILKCNTAIITEGYLDFIIPYQAQITNIVASLGTSLTIEQIRLLKRFTHNAIIIFDADRAGELASLRSLDLFLDEAMDLKVVSLPLGFDPDSFLRKFGKDKLTELIKRAKPLFDYKLQILTAQYNQKELEGKAKIVSEMLPTLNRFTNSVLKSGYLKKLAEYLSVEEEALKAELKKLKPQTGYRMEFLKPPDIKLGLIEKTILKLLLEDKELTLKLNDLSLDYFEDKSVKELIGLILQWRAQGKKIDLKSIINRMPQEQAGIISELAAEELPAVDNHNKILNDCSRQLRRRRSRKLCEEIKEAQNKGDHLRLDRLIFEYNLLIKRLNTDAQEKR